GGRPVARPRNARLGPGDDAAGTGPADGAERFGERWPAALNGAERVIVLPSRRSPSILSFGSVRQSTTPPGPMPHLPPTGAWLGRSSRKFRQIKISRIALATGSQEPRANAQRLILPKDLRRPA